jgi:transposase-like protein
VIEENMGAALSVELRARVVSACRDEGMTYEEAASRFGVGHASVSRWMRLYRETNQLKAKPYPGRTPRIDEVGQALVRQLVETRPDATLWRAHVVEESASAGGARNVAAPTREAQRRDLDRIVSPHPALASRRIRGVAVDTSSDNRSVIWSM